MFEDRLKRLREGKGLNMKQAAIELGITYTTYVGYEKNEREPNSETLILLADYYDCSVDYLVGRTNQVKTNDFGFNVNEHEKKVILAYRQQPSLQIGVDRMLGVESESEHKEKRA